MKIKLLTLIIILAKVNFTLCQPFSQDSVNCYIKALGWESLYIKEASYFPELILDAGAKKLISLKRNSIDKSLFSEITNERKTVVIHIILSKKIEPDSNKFEEAYTYTPKKDSITTVTYSYNHLSWQYDVKTGVYSIEPNEINKIKAYWEDKLKRKIKG